MHFIAFKTRPIHIHPSLTITESDMTCFMTVESGIAICRFKSEKNLNPPDLNLISNNIHNEAASCYPFNKKRGASK